MTRLYTIRTEIPLPETYNIHQVKLSDKPRVVTKGKPKGKPKGKAKAKSAPTHIYFSDSDEEPVNNK